VCFLWGRKFKQWRITHGLSLDNDEEEEEEEDKDDDDNKEEK
jgi:hypothetical protein